MDKSILYKGFNSLIIIKEVDSFCSIDSGYLNYKCRFIIDIKSFVNNRFFELSCLRKKIFWEIRIIICSKYSIICFVYIFGI